MSYKDIEKRRECNRKVWKKYGKKYNKKYGDRHRDGYFKKYTKTKKFKEQRKKYNNSTSLVKKKIQAREKVQKALKRKILSKQPCEICREVIVNAHHTNYDKPLEVIWLCRKHHFELHQKNKML